MLRAWLPHMRGEENEPAREALRDIIAIYPTCTAAFIIFRLRALEGCFIAAWIPRARRFPMLDIISFVSSIGCVLRRRSEEIIAGVFLRWGRDKCTLS